MISVSEFVDKHRKDIAHMRGYKALIKDLGELGNKHTKASNAIISKCLLANNYGHICDCELSLFFRRYVIANTVFEGDVREG